LSYCTSEVYIGGFYNYFFCQIIYLSNQISIEYHMKNWMNKILLTIIAALGFNSSLTADDTTQKDNNKPVRPTRPMNKKSMEIVCMYGAPSSKFKPIQTDSVQKSTSNDTDTTQTIKSEDLKEN